MPNKAPRDKYRLVYIGFTVLGITTLLPWNFFITATEYWMYKFRNISDPTYDPHDPHTGVRTPLQTFFTSYLSIAANLPMLLSMVLNSLYGHKFSQKKRLYVSLIVMLVIFATTTFFVGIDTDRFQNMFFGITMLMVIVITFFSAIFQAAMFGIVASFPQKFMYSMVTGQAVAGLLAVMIQIISMLNNSGPTESGLWYFLSSTVFLAFAILCYWSMDNDYSRYYLIQLPSEMQISEALPQNLVRSRSDLYQVIRGSWQMIAIAIIVFWTTLSVYPGVSVLVVPQHPNSSFFTGRFFTPIACFLLFNCGDLAGRTTSAYLPFPKSKSNLLLILTILRSVIPFLIIFCNVYPRNNTPVLFKSDIYFPILNTASAFTQGYLFTSSMVMASASSDRDKLELTGFIMTTALGIGLTLGSISSALILLII